MKKKHRDIVVEGITYGWIASGHGYSLEIFRDKKVILTVNTEHWIPITPKVVEDVIREFVLSTTNEKSLAFVGVEVPREMTAARIEQFVDIIATKNLTQDELLKMVYHLPRTVGSLFVLQMEQRHGIKIWV